MSIVMHSFNNVEIPQLSQDTWIGGVLVPAGYVNATLMLSLSNYEGLSSVIAEELDDVAFWLHRVEDKTQPFTLSREKYIIELDNIFVIPEIAIHIACKLEPKFNLYCMVLASKILGEECENSSIFALSFKESLKTKVIAYRILALSFKGGFEFHTSYQEIIGWLKGVWEIKFRLGCEPLRTSESYTVVHHKQGLANLVEKLKNLVPVSKPKPCVYFF